MSQMGATIINHEKNKVMFKVFAVNKNSVSLVLKTDNNQKVEYIPMKLEEPNIYSTAISKKGLNFLYKFKINGKKEYPDPYSNFQPSGVHGYSRLINHKAYNWQDTTWKGKDLKDMIIMEIHVGTFTQEGTFKAIINKLKYLSKLGINTIELMPITQTPGQWNWGYDGTNLFSVNHNYGHPDDLKHLIDCCHQHKIGVILDIVYNHFGPEGNYLPQYGPYFTAKHKTPWGPAVNFDDQYCKYIRQMVLDSVHYWLEVYHFDGLRLDAVQTIKDDSPVHILEEISIIAKKSARKQNHQKHIIVETDENNVKLINPRNKGGYGIDAQWMDDFHHCIHTALTGENKGYYIDYGDIKDFKKIYKNYLYTGEYSTYWKKKRGTDATDNPGKQFIVVIQNHDQVGNRAQGDRLSTLIEFPYLKIAAGLMFFSAYIPMLFMGEEYGEKNPFLFFTDYQDSNLKEKVSKGRKKEFDDFSWKEIPDPQNPETFYKSKLTPKNKWQKQNHYLFNFYQDLIILRTSHPVLKKLDKKKLKVNINKNKRIITITRWNQKQKLTGLFNLGKKKATLNQEQEQKRQIFSSNSQKYGGQKEQQKILKPGQMVILECNI